VRRGFFSTLAGFARRLRSASPQAATRHGDLPSGLPCDVADTELLARFLRYSKYFSTQSGTVKHEAFLPNPRDGKSSVFRHPGEPASELWDLGRRELGENVRIHGAGLINARVVRDEKLEVAASEPPPRHANIQAWPKDPDPGIQKARQKEVAMAIAVHARLLLRE